MNAKETLAHYKAKQEMPQVPVAWISFNVLTGQECFGRMPIQSLQPGAYKHTPLYAVSLSAPVLSCDAVDCLRQLVDALDNAFISSWQSTSGWEKQLDQARALLAEVQS